MDEIGLRSVLTLRPERSTFAATQAALRSALGFSAMNDNDSPSHDHAVPGPDGEHGFTQEGALETPVTPPPRKSKVPLGPPVFGQFAWAIILPFVLYWGGTIFFAGYLENVRDRTRLDEARLPVIQAFQQLDEYLGALGKQYGDGARAEWERHLGWDRLKVVVTDPEHIMKVEDFREVGARLYSDSRPPIGDDQLVVALRDRIEELVWFWEQHEARKHGIDPGGVAYKPLVEGGRTEEDIEVSAGLEHLLEEDAASKSWYPTIYTGIAIATTIALICVFPLYLKIPFRINPISFIVGLVGFVVWIGLIKLDHDYLGLGQWLAPKGRAAFDPFEELNDTPMWRNIFIGIRLYGLALLIPIAEEFFLRAWLMRYIDDPDWDLVPMNYMGRLGVMGAVVYGVVAHTGEPLAALAWFGMVTWMYVRTKNVWDCVVAHFVTNLALGIYVLVTHTWSLW
jgi:CAAX prenyl protease-like protein